MGICNSRREYKDHGCHLLVCTSGIRSSQRLEHRSPGFGGQGPFLPHWLPRAVCRLLLERVHTCLSSRGKGELKLTKITALYRPRLPLEIASLHWTLEFHSSPIRQFLMSVCDLGRETDSWCFLLHHFPRVLSLELFLI